MKPSLLTQLILIAMAILAQVEARAERATFSSPALRGPRSGVVRTGYEEVTASLLRSRPLPKISLCSGEDCSDSCDDGCTEFEISADSCTSDSSGGCGLGCDGDPWSLWGALTHGHESPWSIGGWVQGGYHTEANGLFNNHPDRFNIQQTWLYLERAADPSKNGIDWGFRADVVYGTDAQDTQSFGNNPGTWDFQNGFDHGIFGWALPQVYGEIATENVSLIVGHFFTLIGYEVVTAPDNFFYSHAYTMYNSEPFTHTGALATINLSDNLTGYAGWTLGWDTGFDQFGDGNSFLGGLGVQLTDDTSLTYITTFGDFGARGDQGYSHSIVMDTSVTDKLNYVLQSDLVNATNAGVLDHDVGINQYLIYSLTDCVGLGTRVEWWHDDGTSFYEYTAGVNIRPTANTLIRPEIRHDWSPANNTAFTTFGVDAIILF